MTKQSIFSFTCKPPVKQAFSAKDHTKTLGTRMVILYV